MHSPTDGPTSKRQLEPSRSSTAAPRITTGLSSAIDEIRRWGRTRPPLLTVTARLPHVRELGPEEPGLAWEARAVPGISVDSTARVSLVRILACTGGERELVGQIQASGPLDHPLGEPELSWYVHEPERGATREIDDPDEWFTGVVGAYYRAGGAEIDLTPMPALERLR